MQLQAVRSFIISKLEAELPAHLSYHNVHHTKRVFQHVRELASAEKISQYETEILLTAALFHDSGFLETYNGHEEVSCELAKKILPQFDYTEEEIERICSLIMVTKMPQLPSSKLEEILCDADLYYLGTENYFPVADNLYHELQKAGFLKNKNKWVKQQLQFLESHYFFSDTAKSKLSTKQEHNLTELKKMSQSSKSKSISHHDFRLSDILMTLLGVVTAAFALKGFLVPNNFFDGGITGISLLIHEIYHFNLAVVILIANFPLIIMSIYAINMRFAIKTLFCIIMLGVCLHYLPYPVITSDKLLVSIFGGFFLGLGIGFTMRAGCAVDGIEVLALYTWRKTSFTISEIIMALNIIIFSIAALKFGIPTALYSILTYFAASKTVDYVVEGIEAYTGVTIISANSELVKDRLVNELGRGITVYKGERGFLPGNFEAHSDCDIIFTVITRLELRKLKNVVQDVDPDAFVFASLIKETSGGVIKRRHIH
jgi:uncharacterized membrane-anchored protein YitT (DUF2179 family)